MVLWLAIIFIMMAIVTPMILLIYLYHCTVTMKDKETTASLRIKMCQLYYNDNNMKL